MKKKKENNVLLVVTENPEKSVREIEHTNGIAKSIACLILSRNFMLTNLEFAKVSGLVIRKYNVNGILETFPIKLSGRKKVW